MGRTSWKTSIIARYETRKRDYILFNAVNLTTTVYVLSVNVLRLAVLRTRERESHGDGSAQALLADASIFTSPWNERDRKKKKKQEEGGEKKEERKKSFFT